MKNWFEPGTSNTSISMHYLIHPKKEKGSLVQPRTVEFLSDERKSTHDSEKTPFTYLTDAITGLAGMQLLMKIDKGFQPLPRPLPAVTVAWQHLEATYEVYKRSQARIKNYSSTKLAEKGSYASFEKNLKEILHSSKQGTEIHIQDLWKIIDEVSHLEKQLENPLMFNASVNFSESTIEALHVLYSFLYNMRALIALDHNAHIQDATFEALKVDSISDYLPKADYVVNDALLYYHFKSLKSQMPDASWVKSLEQGFHNYVHNGYYLVESLPKSFFEGKAPEDIEEHLFTYQMDWLLGSPAGLLFKVREELFGYRDGFEKVFWHELNERLTQAPTRLEVACELGPKHLGRLWNAA